MLTAAEGLRHFWLKGLNKVEGKPREGVASWLIGGKYIFTAAKDRTEFSIKILDASGLTNGFAHEVTRMATASVETFNGIKEMDNLPRSGGWIVIRAYYGAFFSAHALLRMCGTICFQLEDGQKNELDKVAHVQGMLPTGGFEKGFYIGTYDTAVGDLRLKKSSASRRGSHEVMWEVFSKMLRDQSNGLLRLSSVFIDAAVLLADIADLLCQSGGGSGNWLSQIRNAVNYRHELGVWFPYKNSDVTGLELAMIASHWSEQPEKVMFKNKKSVVAQHVALCTVIAALCNAVVEDMGRTGSVRRSFHAYGALALRNLAKQVA